MLEPGARIIGFPKGAGDRLERYVAATGVDGVSLDWTVPLGLARKRLQRSVAVQGNLDPAMLLAGGDELDAAIDRILAALAGGRFIFNLGHGILPETPIAHVERLVDARQRRASMEPARSGDDLRLAEGGPHHRGDRLDGRAVLSAAAVRLSRRRRARLDAVRDLQGHGAAAATRRS